MNKNRKERLVEIAESLDGVIDFIQEVIDEEQESFDNMPESFQNGVRGDSMLEAIDIMEEFTSDVENVRDSIEEYGRK